MSTATTSSYPASYKKEPGVIEIVDGTKLFLWKPINAGSTKQPIKFPLDTVAQLQATSPKSEKLQLKIVCTYANGATGSTPSAPASAATTPQPGAGDGPPTQSYQFAFKDRTVMEDAKTTIQKLVQAIRAITSENTPAIGGDNSSQNKSGTDTTANNSSNRSEDKQAVVDLDSKKLLLNLNLQQALLRENKDLMRTFQETVIHGGLANDKFWNTRIHLLRAYALTSSQKRGAYNVLGTIRPTTGSDNQINVSLTREKIHDIFEQYPIVRQAYSDNVPSKMNEGSFWERFFLSRLFRRLRGEKVPTTHIIDAVLDTKYLTLYEDEQEEYNNRILGGERKIKRDEKVGVNSTNNKKRDHETDDEEFTGDIYRKIVPQYLDIGGNEENDPQKLGNLPDITMQPGKSDASSISLIRSMNSLSQRMLYGNAAPHIISGNPEADSNELAALREQLKFDDLEGDHIYDSNLELHLLNEGNASNGTTAKANDSADELNIEKYRQKYSKSLKYDGPLVLNNVGQNIDDVKSAVHQVSTIIRLRSKESDQVSKIWTDNDQDKRLLDQVQLCHATSIEFLRHFWLNFQSGDPGQASSIAKLVVSLSKSLERIDAVSKAAPTPEAQSHARSSLSPLEVSIKTALEQYEKALEESNGISEQH